MTQSDSDRLFTIIFVFVAVIFALIFKWVRMNDSDKSDIAKGTGGRRELRLERFLIILTAVALRVAFAGATKGFQVDVNCFKTWASWAAEDFPGLYSRGADAFLDYPPGYMYILFFIGKIRELFSIPYESAVFTFLIKLPAIAADIISGILLYKIARNNGFSERKRLFIMSVYLFNPAVYFVSTIWGQIDSILALLAMVAAIYLANGKYELSAVFFALGVLVKPQGIIFLPALFFECLIALLANWRIINRLLVAVACFVGTFALAIIPFSFGKHPLWIVDLYSNTLESYSYASMNAFNFHALLGNNMSSDSTLLLNLKTSTWGYIFIVIFTILSGVVILQYRRFKDRRREVMQEAPREEKQEARQATREAKHEEARQATQEAKHEEARQTTREAKHHEARQTQYERAVMYRASKKVMRQTKRMKAVRQARWKAVQRSKWLEFKRRAGDLIRFDNITNPMPLLTSALLIMGVTTFAHKMHERYFFPAMLLLLAVYSIGGGGFFGVAFVLTTIAGYFNVLIIFSIYHTNSFENFGNSPLVYVLSALTVLTTVLTWLFVLKSRGNIPLHNETERMIDDER